MPVFQLTLDVSHVHTGAAEAARSFDTLARAASSTRKTVAGVPSGFSTKTAQRNAEEFRDVLEGMAVSADKSSAIIMRVYREYASEVEDSSRQTMNVIRNVETSITKSGEALSKISKTPLLNVSTYQELAQYSESLSSSTMEQNRQLEAQARYYKDILGVSEAIVDEWKASEQKILTGQDFSAGLSRGMRGYRREVNDLANQADLMTRDLSRSFETALTSPIDTFLATGQAGLLDFKSMFNSLLSDLFRMAIAKPITVSIVGAVGGLLASNGTAQAAGGGLGVTYGDALKLAQSSLGLFGSSGMYTGAASSVPASFLAAGTGQMYPIMNTIGAGTGAMSALSTPGITGVGQQIPIIPMPGITPGTPVSSGMGAAGTALGYGASAVGGYFTGRGFYEGYGAKWGLPQGRETGWASGVGGALGGMGGMYLGGLAASAISAGLGLASGSAIGATIGSVVPGIGTAIGAVVGAIAAGLAGSLGGKDREMRVYTGLRTNLADPGAYIQTDQSQEAMAGAFGYGWTQADFMKDWGSINVKGSTGHSAYYIDPVHAGSKGDEVATTMAPYFEQVEETLLGMATSVTDLLPQQLKGQFTNWLRERPMVLEYKFKPGDLDQEGIEAWIADWTSLTEDVLLRGLQELDFSAWNDQITVNMDSYSGFQMFLNAVDSIEAVKKATEELVNPTSQFVLQAREANAQLDAWALSLRQYGVTQEYAADLMEQYKQTSIDVFLKGFKEAFTPLPAFAQALKEAGEALDGRIAGLRALGATEAQIMALELRRGEVMTQAVADLLRQTSQDYSQRYTAITGGDTEGLRAAINRENELRKLAQTFGTGNDWTGTLLEKAAALNAEKYQGKTDWNIAAVEKAIAEAGMTVSTWYTNFGKDEGFSGPINLYEKYQTLLAAEEEKRTLDALKKSQQQYLNAQLSAVRSLASAWGAVQRGLADSRTALHASVANPNPGLRTEAAQQNFNDLYAKALAGDEEAARQLGAAATTLLDAARRTAATGSAYQLVFNDVDRKLLEANLYAGKQFDAARAQLDALQTTTGLMGSQLDLSAQILAQEKALEEAIKNISLPATLPSPGGSTNMGGGQSKTPWSILEAKAASLNQENAWIHGRAPGSWTPESLLETIISLDMTFAQWYENFGKAEGFASGGVTPAGRPFWVGENGPELMMSTRQYGVLSNPESARLIESLSGAPVAVTPPAYADTRAELAALRAENQAARAELCRAVAALERISRHTKDSADDLAAVRTQGLATRAYTPPPYPVIPFPE